MQITKIKTLLKQNYGYILLIIFLTVVSVLSFNPGKDTLSNDNYSPELNPSLTVERSLLSPAWRTYRVLGFGSESEQADVFRAGMFQVMDVVLPTSVLGQIYYLICLFVGSIFIAKLAEKIAQSYKGIRRNGQLIVLLTGVGYVTTLWTIWVFYQNMGPYITNFGFLPLLLYSVYRYIEFSSPKKALYLFISAILFTATSVIATVFLVDLIFLFFFILFFAILKGKVFKVVLKKVIYTLLIIAVTQLFWILPFIFYTLTTSQDLLGSFVNRSITTSVLDLETQMQTPINSARLYSRILTDSGGRDVLFGMGDDYLIYDFYKVFGLFPAIFSLLLVPFAILKKKNALLFFPLFAIGSWFFIKVTNPPLGVVFTWFQDNIPLFKQVFRWPVSKLGNIFLLNVIIASSFGLVLLLKYLSSFFKKKFVKSALLYVPVLLFLLVQMLYAEFLFTGKLFSPVSLLDIPQEYYSLNEYLSENDNKGRIYYAPPSNNNYFREYEWGFWGSQFISYIIPNPVMDLSLAIGSEPGEKAMLDIANIFRSGNKEKFLNLMQRYDVRYILVDESVSFEGYTFEVDWEVSEFLWEDLSLLWQEGKLSLYEVPVQTEKLLKESLDVISSDFNYDSYFVRDIPRTLNIYATGVESSQYSVEDNHISKSFRYLGQTQNYSLTVDSASARSLPTKVTRLRDSILLTPSYPYIDIESEIITPSKTFGLQQEHEYYVVEDHIFSRQEVNSGVSVEKEYFSLNDIYGLNEDDFLTTVDLVPFLSESEGEDCSGIQDLNYEVKVLDQGVASGISLRGDAELPCVYTPVSIDSDLDYVVKVKLNWEGQDDVFAGFCLYSGNKGECLNEERYMYSKEPFGDLEFLIKEKIDADDNISLVLYALDSKNKGISDLVFRDVIVSWAQLRNRLQLTSEEFGGIEESFTLESGMTYDIKTPILYGSNSYSYIIDQKPNLIWQPNSENVVSEEVTWDNGMYQEVKEGFLNQSNTLFPTSPNNKYLVYVQAENESNIPANVCVLYSGENKCWYQDIFTDSSEYSNVSFFNSNSSFTNSLDVLFNSYSYQNTSKNKLENFVLMKVPSIWDNIEYVPEERSVYVEYEMDSKGSSPHSTTYSLSELDMGHGNRIVSISQAQSEGWLGILRGDYGLRILGRDQRVTINGWKQGWDVSDLEFNSMYVIYWPNLLGYLGYVLIVVQLGIITTLIFKQKIHFKYGKK
jgi:hypothetical protein